MNQQHRYNILRWLKGVIQRHLLGMITCREFEDFILDYLDDELPALQRSRFERHIRLCCECRQYLQAYQRTLEVSRAVFPSPEALVPDAVPEDLIKAILKARKN
jgi:anti-sigma factor RsiW